MTRVEHYLKRLLENPGEWVRITKRKNQATRQTNENERDRVIQDIKTALNLMGIRYDQLHTTKLRVWSEAMLAEEKERNDLSAWNKQMQASFIASLTIPRRDAIVKFSLPPNDKLSGKKIKFAVFDDLIDTKVKNISDQIDAMIYATGLVEHKPGTEK